MGTYDTLREYVKMVATGSTNNLILLGNSSIGKTIQTLDVFIELGQKNGEDYILSGGFTTPLDFYHFAYEHRDKTLILDDLAGILTDKRSVAIFKEILWGTPKRMVHYHTTSDALTAPPEFEFTGKIILITNLIEGKNSENTKALLSRAITYELVLSRDDILNVMKDLCQNIVYKDLTLVEKATVLEYIQSITDETTSELNLRSLIKSYDIYYHYKKFNNDWKKLVSNLFTKDETLVSLKMIITAYSTERERIKAFFDATGLRRGSYYLYKRRLNL